jgi:hypothetical protein
MTETKVLLRAGDIVLTGRKSQGIVSLAIKLGSKLRFGMKSPYARWSHAALVVDAEKFLVAEARSHGVVVSDMRARFPTGDFSIIATGGQMIATDVEQVLRFADAVVKARTRYGFLTFAGLALYCLTGGKLCLQQAGTAICSGFVCDALTRAGYIWERPPFSMMPADIASHFDFKP